MDPVDVTTMCSTDHDNLGPVSTDRKRSSDCATADILVNSPGKMVKGVHPHESTGLYEGDGLMEDGEFNTQILNLGEETQLVDFEYQTQVIDFEEGIENVDTQVLDELDTQVGADSCNEDKDHGEGRSGSGTEVVGLSCDELSDDNTVSNKRSGSYNEQEMGCSYNSASTEKKDRSDVSNDWPSISGSVKRGFTYVRSASLRAAGLAARSLNLSGSRSLPSDVHSPAEFALGENVFAQDEVLCKVESTNLNEMKCKVGSSAVRKLFPEHQQIDSKSGSPDLPTDLKGVPLGDDRLAGLSYIESQEAGDLSQENALKFVEKFLEDNVEELPNKINTAMTSREKTAQISATKGRHILAITANMVTPRETQIFEWDGSREDEGGGDLFCRRKEEFFKDGSIKELSTHPMNEKRHRSGVFGARAEPLTIPSQTIRVSHFGSRINQFRSRGRDKTCEKDLGDQLDERCKANSSGGDLERPVDDPNVPDMPQIGQDTQLAAEAMEELCMGEVLADASNNDGSWDLLGNTKKRSRKWTLDYVSPEMGGHTIDWQRRHEDDTSISKMASISLKKHPKKLKEPHSFESKKIVLGLATRTNKHSMVPARKKQNVLKGQESDEGGVGLLIGDGVSLPVAKRTRSSFSEKETLGAQNLQNFMKKDSSVLSEDVCKRKRTTRAGKNNQRSVDASKVDKKGSSSELASDPSGHRRNAKADIHAERTGHVTSISSSVGEDGNAELVVSPAIKSKGFSPASVTPNNCSTTANSISPLCVGNEYFKQSCKKNLMKEIRSLTSSASKASPECKSLRRRRDMTNVHILFSHHLDDETVKQQKKILARLGASVVSSIAEATHFVTDEFMRTRNLLEAIASGKPVVTHLWLESCGQACCFLDERNYVLRDTKKEKLFGFSMPNSLARACQQPLLQGKRVLVTPNTKPGKEIISSLVKAVHGQPTERLGRSALSGDKVPDDLLILSCVEDYDLCLPFLEKGATVYSSELLLNGIVIQRLEYERHRLFGDHVRRTRSTMWLKKGGKNFVPMGK